MFTNNATMAYYLLSINTGHREFYCSIPHGFINEFETNLKDLLRSLSF